MNLKLDLDQNEPTSFDAGKDLKQKGNDDDMAFDEESPTDVPEIRKSDRSNSVFYLPDANLDNSFK